MNKLENRKMLIDTFVNSVVLYDDRIDFYFNFKDNAKSLTLSELNTVSDLSSSSPPNVYWTNTCFFSGGFAVKVML
ncbi:hypothetical protein [Eubacterium sp.]|uniref:hypothetical protein n=1 Tax=Eubacterium sp. TaxID=142586 RepID=UPI0025C53BCB|nr:hypothetical protein [Eubacterium sp.]